MFLPVSVAAGQSGSDDATRRGCSKGSNATHRHACLTYATQVRLITLVKDYKAGHEDPQASARSGAHVGAGGVPDYPSLGLQQCNHPALVPHWAPPHDMVQCKSHIANLHGVTSLPTGARRHL